MNSPRVTLLALAALIVAFTSPAPVRAGHSTAQTAPQLSAASPVDAVLAEVGHQLVSHFRLEGDLQLESLRAVSLPTARPDSPAAPAVEILEFPAQLASSMIVRVRLGDASEQTLVLRAQLLREVWIVRSPLPREAAFDVASLDTRRVDVLRERDTIPASELCPDHILTRAVPVGRILTWRDVARRPLVRKGQVIDITAVDGALSITMKALAMENGASGETVKVRNLESKKEFNAQVVADARAQIRF